MPSIEVTGSRVRRLRNRLSELAHQLEFKAFECRLEDQSEKAWLKAKQAAEEVQAQAGTKRYQYVRDMLQGVVAATAADAERKVPPSKESVLTGEMALHVLLARVSAEVYNDLEEE